MDRLFKLYDEKITKLRQDFDLGKLERLIKSKGDITEMNKLNENLEF